MPYELFTLFSPYIPAPLSPTFIILLFCVSVPLYDTTPIEFAPVADICPLLITVPKFAIIPAEPAPVIFIAAPLFTVISISFLFTLPRKLSCPIPYFPAPAPDIVLPESTVTLDDKNSDLL